MNATDRAIAKMQSLQSLLYNDREHEPELSGADSVDLHRVGRVLRAQNKALGEEVMRQNRMIAALVVQAGGEMRVDDLTLALMPMDAVIEIWSESMDRTTVVRVRMPKHPTVPISEGGPVARPDSRKPPCPKGAS